MLQRGRCQYYVDRNSMPIIIVEGKILLVGGLIAMDESCCCCPCCIVQTGSFHDPVEDADVIISNIVISPTVACLGEDITITFDVTNNTVDPVGTAPDGTNLDYDGSIFTYVSSSPAGTNTIVGFDGNVEWFTSIPASSTVTFSATFTVNSVNCEVATDIIVLIWSDRGPISGPELSYSDTHCPSEEEPPPL